MDWYIGVLKKYAVFEGRARRKEYWMFFLFNVIISVAIGFVLGFIGGMLGIGTSLSTPVSTIYYLAVIIPSIAVGIRRMHDIGRSGWWILVPVVNLVFACMDSQPSNNEYGHNPKAA
ncbi:MAG TPA: DUF805 domain-containing protein [Geobacteraceae bacterium]|nr:DUF805 domain-containing protein [Geobacteraceae bacterium]